MTGLTSLLNTARDALTAQAYGVSVAGQNITNVNTEGYSRREVILETRALGSESYGGVKVEGLRQITDRFLDSQQLVSLSHQSAAREHNQGLAGIEALFNDEAGTGLGSSLDALFNSFSSLAANPSDTTAREQVLDAAEYFSSNVRQVADELASTRDKLLTKAKDVVNQVNTRAEELADLNRRIITAEAQGRDAADLKDQRAQVLLDLAPLIDIRTTVDGAGGILVHSAGVVLVEGSTARSFSAGLNGDGSLKLSVNTSSGAGSDVTRYLTGGALAGIKETRDGDIFEVAKRLDELVFDVGNALNEQHALGVGLDGTGGRNIFDVSATSQGAARALTVSDDVAGNPEAIAAAFDTGTLPGGSDNAVALLGVGKSALSGSGRSVFETYGELVGDVALRKSSAQRSVEMREALHAQNQAMREALSGVSLDEEMISLTKYQRAYEAAAKVLSTVDEMLQELMARVAR